MVVFIKRRKFIGFEAQKNPNSKKRNFVCHNWWHLFSHKKRNQLPSLSYLFYSHQHSRCWRMTSLINVEFVKPVKFIKNRLLDQKKIEEQEGQLLGIPKNQAYYHHFGSRIHFVDFELQECFQLLWVCSLMKFPLKNHLLCLINLSMTPLHVCQFQSRLLILLLWLTSLNTTLIRQLRGLDFTGEDHWLNL